MIQGDIHASHVIKDKGEQFQQEVADRLLEVRQGFAPEDVKSCRMSTHGEDIILSPEGQTGLADHCRVQGPKETCSPHNMETGAPSGKGIVSPRAA